MGRGEGWQKDLNTLFADDVVDWKSWVVSHPRPRSAGRIAPKRPTSATHAKPRPMSAREDLRRKQATEFGEPYSVPTTPTERVLADLLAEARMPTTAPRARIEAEVNPNYDVKFKKGYLKPRAPPLTSNANGIPRIPLGSSGGGFTRGKQLTRRTQQCWNEADKLTSGGYPGRYSGHVVACS